MKRWAQNRQRVRFSEEQIADYQRILGGRTMGAGASPEQLNRALTSIDRSIAKDLAALKIKIPTLQYARQSRGFYTVWNGDYNAAKWIATRKIQASNGETAILVTVDGVHQWGSLEQRLGFSESLSIKL